MVEESLTVGGGSAEYVTTAFTGQRRSAMVYPNGWTVYYDYHRSGALDSVSDNSDHSDPIARYDYIGGRTLMRRMQNHVDLDLAQRDGRQVPTDRVSYVEDTFRVTGKSSMNRFTKRPSQRCRALPTGPERWVWGDTLHVNPSGAATMKIGFDYAYDRAGNKTKQDSLDDPKDNQTYRYDSTGRLVGYDRGDSQGQTWTGMNSGRDWNLDGLGNWDWVEANEDLIELHYLPSYSPDLNPDEYLNNDLKNGVSKRPDKRGKGCLAKCAFSQMRSIQKQPSRVKNYFHAKPIQYAM